MTPAQQALYDRVLRESLAEVGGAAAGPSMQPIPQQAPDMPPGYPPPAPQGYTGPLSPTGRTPQSTLDWIRTRAAQIGGAPAAPMPPPPRFAAPPSGGLPPPSVGPGGAGGDVLPNPYGRPDPRPPAPPFPGPALTPEELARARAHPIATPDERPYLPAQRPSAVAMMAAPPQYDIGERRAAPLPQQGGPAGGYSAGTRRMDPTLFLDLFPGIFGGLNRRLEADRQRQFARDTQLLNLSAQDAQQQRDLQARYGDRGPSLSDMIAMQRLQMAQDAAARQANATPRDYSAQDELSRARADYLRAQAERAQKPKAGGGGGAPRGPVLLPDGSTYSATAAMDEAILAQGKGDTPGVLAAAGKADKAGDRKTAADIRKLASQGAMYERRGNEAAKQADAGAAVPGWTRREGAPRIEAAESSKMRGLVAQTNILKNVSRRMAQLNAQMTPEERAEARAGKYGPRAAEALQLQSAAVTALREIEQTGVPSAAEMASANRRAPELTTADGWLNGAEKFAGMSKAMDMVAEQQMRARGYDREQPKPRKVTKPDGTVKENQPLTDSQVQALQANGFKVE